MSMLKYLNSAPVPVVPAVLSSVSQSLKRKPDLLPPTVPGNIGESSQEGDATALVGQAGELLQSPNGSPTKATLTEEQLARIEANRLAALEKRKAKQKETEVAKPPGPAAKAGGGPPGPPSGGPTRGFEELEGLFRSEAWKRLLQSEFSKPYWAALKRFLVAEQSAGRTIFPPMNLIFNAFDACPPERVKVVILGQDPYHDVGQAEGLCFSVPRGQKIPSSLQNIYKELRDCVPEFKQPNHGHLGAWANQGVFLLNTSLTVRAHEAASHSAAGWQIFTDAVVAQLSSQREGLVFFLWGKHAQEKARHINKSKRHIIFKSAHPSGLSANRGFFGCKHFSLANEFLEKQGQAPINWQI